MTALTPIPEYAAPAADPAGQFGPDAEELELFPEPAAAPAPPAEDKPRGKPGPAPNPNSKRQQKLRDAAKRARTVTPPARRGTANTTVKAQPNTNEVWQRGALSMIGWITKPLAMGGFALGVASQNTRMPAKKRQDMAALSLALTLDSFTIGMHAEALAEGAAELAPELPWLQRALESSAKIGPYAKVSEALVAITVQVLCNHGVIPPMEALGTLGPEDLAAAAGVPMDGPPAE